MRDRRLLDGASACPWLAPAMVVVFALASLSGLLVAPARAADDAGTAAADAAAPAPAQAPQTSIELGKIPSAIERARATLRSADAVATPRDEIAHIGEAVPEFTRKVHEREVAARRLLATEPPVEVLDDLSAEWDAFDESIRTWNAVLARRVQELDDQVRAVQEIDEAWAQREQQAREAGAPAPTLEQIRALRADIASTRQRVEAARDRVLTLQAKLSDPGERVASVLDAARQARSERVGKLFVRDRAPLWSPSIRDQQLRDLPAKFRDAVRADAAAAVGYLDARRTQVLFELLGMWMLAWVLVRARRHLSEREGHDARLETISAVLERPLSAAIVIGVALLPLLHPRPPPQLGALVRALALIPTLRILAPLFGPGLRPALYALAGFFLVDQLRHAAVDLPFVPRALFTLEMSAGALVMVWVLRPSRLASLPPAAGRESRFRWASRGLRLLLIAFATGLVAAVLGYMQLAVFIGAGALRSAYLAAIVYALVRTGQGVVVVLLRTSALARLGLVRRHRELLDRRTCRAIRVAGALVWVVGTIDVFSLRDRVIDLATRILSAELAVGNLSLSLGDVLLFVATVWLAFLISRFVRLILDEEVYHRLSLRRGVPYAISALVHYGILLSGFLLAVLASGVDLDRFALLAGAFGVGIGFGLQNVVNNFVSGLILLFERPVQVSDTVQLGDLLGEVRRIGIRSSTVRTWEGAEVIVPNANLISTEVTNWTLSDRLRRIDLPVGVAYGNDPDRVIGILKAAADSNARVLDDPPVEVLFLGFGDSSLDFQIRAWTSSFLRFPTIRSEIALAASRALKEAHIEIPFPQRDLHVRSVDPEAGRALHGRGDGPDGA